MKKKLLTLFLAGVIAFTGTNALAGVSVDLFDNLASPPEASQPDSTLSGSTLLITFRGDDGASRKIYYMEADASLDFSDDTLTGDQVRTLDPLLVDETTPAYTEGLFPTILPFTVSGVQKAGILFSGDGNLLFATIDLSSGAVESVTSVPTSLTGNINSLDADIDSAGRVHAVLSMRNTDDEISYVSFEASDPTNASTFFESAAFAVSKQAECGGNPPQVSVSADTDGNAHLLWASCSDPDGNGTYGWFVSYTMFDPTRTGEEHVISPTLIFGQEGQFFVFPDISAVSTSEVYASAQTYEGMDSGNPSIFLAGSLYLALINPNLVPAEGTPPYSPATPEEIFTLPPYNTNLTFLKPSILSDTEHRTHILGNGYEGSGITFASYEYQSGELSLAEPQKRVALDDRETFESGYFASERASLEYFTSGKAVVLYTGFSNTGERHLFLTTTTAPAFPPQPEPESGCSVSGKAPGGDPITLVLSLGFLYFLSRRKAFRL